MSAQRGFAAGILETSSAGYAGVAASLLVERDGELETRWGTDAFAAWKSNLSQRILELAAALRADEPGLFVARVRWSRRAFEARGLPVDDLEASLESLSEVLRDQLPESAAADVDEVLRAGLDALRGEGGDAEDEPALDPDDPMDRLALGYLAAVLEGDPRAGRELVLQAVDDGLEVRDAYLRVLLPAQREIGRLWHSGSASVAEEHLVTGTTERLMAVLWERAERRESTGRRAVVAAVEGNAHEVGIRAVADFLELAGWQVQYLGADVPTPDLVNVLRGRPVDAVFLSGSLSTQVGTLGTAVRALKELDSPPRVIVGGAAFDAAPGLWERLGADAYAPDVESAVRLAEGEGD